jgi:hypothetical protein
MAPGFRLTAAVLDTPDPKGLARFCRRLLGWPLGSDEPDRVTVRPEDGSAGLSLQPESDHVPPVWPAGSGDRRMQPHLDVEVDDLAAATELAASAGARVAAFRPQDDVRVCLDPAGHPFCLGVRT